MEIFFHKKFTKQLLKMPLRLREQFGKRLQIFIDNKYDRQLNNHSVDAVFPDCRSINITGDYRAIYRESSDGILFVDIGTHSELYG